jgi:hypothetical protein
MRKMLLTCATALVVVAPAQAGGGHDRELTISGAIVRASATAVSVEGADSVLTCAVPERSPRRPPGSEQATACGCTVSAIGAGGHSC